MRKMELFFKHVRLKYLALYYTGSISTNVASNLA
jgi:hypothetical protein